MIYDSLYLANADFSKYDKIKSFSLNNISIYTSQGAIVSDHLLSLFTKYEYTFEELKEVYNDYINSLGYEFNGYTIKLLFPSFIKTRKTTNNKKITIYNFKQ